MLFKLDATKTAATEFFVHVYVPPHDGYPLAITHASRQLFEKLVVTQ